LPLEGLFLRLEAAGFEITPADRLRVYRLLRAFGPDNLKNPEELGMILGPALCHNGGEQAKFARIYAAYLAELKETRPVLGSQLTGGEQTTEKKVRRWFDRAWPYIMLASFAIALAAFFLLRDEIRGDGATTVDITGPDFARIDEAITFKNRSYFAGKDSTTLKWVWTVTSGAAGDTILIDSTNWDLPYRVTPMIDEEARQLITLEVWAPGTNSNGRTIKYLDVKCSSPPPLIGIELPAIWRIILRITNTASPPSLTTSSWIRLVSARKISSTVGSLTMNVREEKEYWKLGSPQRSVTLLA
jgi:hypothetical protein